MASESEIGTVSQILSGKDKAQAVKLKDDGNGLFGTQMWNDALEAYQAAILFCPDDEVVLLAACHCNRGACHIMMEAWNLAIQECTEALKLKPDYTRAFARRAKAFEESDRQFEALEDWKALLKIESANEAARQNIKRLEPIVAEKTEKQKTEVFGKLKDLGNSLLGNFGMSLDNFKAVQDPATGSYSISFQQ